MISPRGIGVVMPGAPPKPGRRASPRQPRCPVRPPRHLYRPRRTPRPRGSSVRAHMHAAARLPGPASRSGWSSRAQALAGGRAARMGTVQAGGGQVGRVRRVARQPGPRVPDREVADAGEGRRQGVSVGVPGFVHPAAGASSTIRPAYITAAGRRCRRAPPGRGRSTRVLVCSATCSIRPQDLHLDHHVQRGGRLVRDDQPGVAGQRHGDHHALPLTARQLMGVGVGPRAAGRPDLFQQLADRPVAAAGGPPARAAGSARRSGPRSGAPRSARALHPGRRWTPGPAHRPQPPRLHGEDVLAVDRIRPVTVAASAAAAAAWRSASTSRCRSPRRCPASSRPRR